MNKLFYMNINQIRSEEKLAEARTHLSDSRLAKIDRCAQYNDKLRSAAAGLLIDCGLGFYHLNEKNATYSYSEHGKPSIAGRPEIHFSLSHSGDYVVCAFSDTPVGVDIEKLKNIKPSLITYTCSPEEAAKIQSYEHGDPLLPAAFFDIWTQKESFLKYLGIGLTVRPSEIATQFSGELAKVNFFTYAIDVSYRCTLCTEGEKAEMTEIQF